MSEQVKRYCTVEESLIESFKEVKLIREGKAQAMSLDDLWADCARWKEEEESDVVCV